MDLTKIAGHLLYELYFTKFQQMSFKVFNSLFSADLIQSLDGQLNRFCGFDVCGLPHRAQLTEATKAA